MADNQVNIDLKADPSSATGGLDQVNAALEPMKDLGKKLKEPIEVAKRFASVFFEVGAVVGLAAAGIAAFATAVQRASSTATAAGREFAALSKTIDDIGKVKVSATGFADLDKEIDALVEARTKLSGSALNKDTSEQGAKRFKELADELDTKQAEIEQRARDRKARAEANEREARYQDAQRLINDIAQEELSEEDKIEQQRERGIERADQLRRQAEDDFQREVAENLDAAVRRRADRESQALRERRAAEEKVIEEAAQERERREIDANQRITDDLARSLTAAFVQANAELAQAINQNNSRLTATVENIGRLVQLLYVNQPGGAR